MVTMMLGFAQIRGSASYKNKSRPRHLLCSANMSPMGKPAILTVLELVDGLQTRPCSSSPTLKIVTRPASAISRRPLPLRQSHSNGTLSVTPNPSLSPFFTYTGEQPKHQRQVYRTQFHQFLDNAGCPHEATCRKTHVQLVAEAASNAYNGTSK